MLRRIATGFLHQAFCPYALAAVAAASMFIGAGLARGTVSDVRSVLTMNPFYPTQIAVGLVLGYLVGRYLEWPFARWTWVVPGSILLIAAVFAPVPVGLSRLGYLFGWSGLPRQGVVSLQLAVTMPFYLSAAYSLAAWIGKQQRGRRSAVVSGAAM
jgi:hypothetical protein